MRELLYGQDLQKLKHPLHRNDEYKNASAPSSSSSSSSSSQRKGHLEDNDEEETIGIKKKRKVHK
jgi:hypothetical protein